MSVSEYFPRSTKSSPLIGVLAELAPWFVMLGTLAAALSLYRLSLDVVAGIVTVVALVAMLPVGIGWFLCGYTDIGFWLFGSRIGTFFFAGFVTYLFHGGTTESVWLDVVYILALAPAALHVFLVPPVSAAILTYHLISGRPPP